MTSPDTTSGAPTKEIGIFVALLVLLLCGFFMHFYAAGQDFLQAVLSTLRMLLLEDSADKTQFDAQGAGGLWSAYQFLRIAVAVVASWLLIETYLHLIGSSGNWVNAWLRRHDVLILGGGTLGAYLALEHKRKQPGKRVALLTQTPDSPTHTALRKQGVNTFGGSALSQRNLRWLAVRRVPVVYVLADSDMENLAILNTLMAYFRKPAADAPMQTCLVHVSDDFLAARIAETDWHQRSGQRCQVRVFNAWKNSARKLVSSDAHSPHKHTELGQSPHVLMLGFSTMGRCVLEQLARLGHYPDGRKARLSVVDPEAAAIQAQVYASFPALEPAPNAVTVDNKPVIDVGFITAPVAGFEAQALRKCTPISVAYICCASLEESITAMHALLMAAPELTFPIVLCTQEDIAPELRQAIVALDRCHVFDTLQHGFGLEQGEPVLNEFAEREAALVHLGFKVFYLRKLMEEAQKKKEKEKEENAKKELEPNEEALKAHQATLRNPESAPLPAQWVNKDKAEEWERESSRDVVRHLNVKQHYFSMLLEGEQGHTLPGNDKRRLSELEHRRWCAERLLLGWRYTNEKKDTDFRLHCDLRPFDKLGGKDQEKDAIIVAISGLLVKARPPNMTTKDLTQHPEAFCARSKPVTVRARFAPAAGVVDTLEGSVKHNAGDAIVTGVEGESWPVERERFLASYKAKEEGQGGQDGYYTKRPKDVFALHLAQPHSVTLSQDRGQLQGQAGDYLVQYAPGDQAIVEHCIFDRTYERLDS